MTVPTSWAVTTLSTVTCPVSRSTSTSATCALKYMTSAGCGASCSTVMVRGRVARRSKIGAFSAMELRCCSGRQHDAEDVLRVASRGGHHGEIQSGTTTRTHTGDGTPK